ncbi:hypothetical protein GK677_02015 [Bifidobacteriaceae bacterium NR044]|nr:hypothetical protein [uncultured Gardnerella sp.]MBF9308642.1 hypothetical protein [Bifidobacteriaceae bacterium NR043]MBF9353546.1 hypothetical protein [Bifidobacteriaceae bacterium NR044]RFT37004.1 hypothetical protein CG398_08205 [Bifidobacteriaceae bacterium NR003]
MRKIIVILCAAIVSLLVVSTIIDSQATQVIPVAAHNIHQGSKIRETDVNYIRVPQHSVFRYALAGRVNSRNPLIATCEIKTGMPILQNAVSHLPNIPEGFTSISVHLSSSDHTIIPGEEVDLAFSKPLQDEGEKSDDSTKNGENTQEAGGSESKSSKNSKNSKDSENSKNSESSDEESEETEETDITQIDRRYVDVVNNVIVMRIAKSQQSSQDQQNTTTLAMPAADALRLLQAQSVNPSLAIVAMKHVNNR